MAAFLGPTLVFTSDPSGVGGASQVFNVPGLKATDTILAVTQKTPGASDTLSFLGWTAYADNSFTAFWVADPGVGGVLEIAVRR